MARVLVIDDYPAILEIFQWMLVSAGHDVRTAADGMEGLRLAGVELPELVLLDVDLPRMNGLAVCAALQALAAPAGVPVLMITGRPQPGLRLAALAAGARDLLHKPISRDALLQAIDTALGPVCARG